MAISRLFMTSTDPNAPLDGSGGSSTTPQVSDFLTVQSLANFAAMTGAITAAWQALQSLNAGLATKWVPFGFALVFGMVSVALSWEGLKKNNEVQFAAVAAAIFVAIINALVLYGAVVGIDVAAT